MQFLIIVTRILIFVMSFTEKLGIVNYTGKYFFHFFFVFEISKKSKNYSQKERFIPPMLFFDPSKVIFRSIEVNRLVNGLDKKLYKFQLP